MLVSIRESWAPGPALPRHRPDEDGVDEATGNTFGAQLRRLRRAAGITQEELAERAHLSPRAISDLEREVKQRPHLQTIELLADALELADADRADLFDSISRRRGPPESGPDATVMPALPAGPTRLVGRERDEAALVHLLRWGTSRVVTLTGAGGVGKTRLALKVAGTLAANFADGVAFIPLASVRDPDLVAASIAGSLGIREDRDRAPAEILMKFLSGRPMLLVIDNFEQVVEAAPLLADLRSACPHLQLLVTSREALHLRGEQEFSVLPLSLPEIGLQLTVELVDRYPATALFMQRAREVVPDLALSADDARTIGEICRRLDGLPLAIELAAARMKHLKAADLLARLASSLQVLTGGARDLPHRHQTMRNTIAWSYDLLNEHERMTFRRLAVFTGGFTLDAAHWLDVLSGDRDDCEDVLFSLVDKSLLLRPREDSGGLDFVMLETVREYGLDCLTPAERASVEQRHAEYYVPLSELAHENLTGPTQGTWLTRLDAEQANVRLALESLIQTQQNASAAHLANGMAVYWHTRSRLREGRAWYERLLPLLEDAKGDREGRVLGSLLNNLAWFAHSQGDVSYAATLFEQSVTVNERAGYKKGIGIALNNLGMIAHHQSEYERAAEYYQASLTLRREVGDSWGVATSLNNLALVSEQQGDYQRAVELFTESLRQLRAIGDKPAQGAVLDNLAHRARRSGNLDAAESLFAESLAVKREIGDAWGLAIALWGMGALSLDRGLTVRAAGFFRQSLELCRSESRRDGAVENFEGLAQVALDSGDTTQAARLLGISWALREAMGTPIPAEDQVRHSQLTEAIVESLGNDRFTLAWKDGQELPLLIALDEALQFAECIERRGETETRP